MYAGCSELQYFNVRIVTNRPQPLCYYSKYYLNKQLSWELQLINCHSNFYLSFYFEVEISWHFEIEPNDKVFRMLPARNSRRKCSSWCCSSRSAASAPGPPPAAGSASYNTATSAIKYWFEFIFFIGRRWGLELDRKTYQVPKQLRPLVHTNFLHRYKRTAVIRAAACLHFQCSIVSLQNVLQSRCV